MKNRLKANSGVTTTHEKRIGKRLIPITIALAVIALIIPSAHSATNNKTNSQKHKKEARKNITNQSAPAATIPPEFTSAAEKLFALDIADPSKGEYRVVEVYTLGYAGTTIQTTHAWVMPEKDSLGRQYAAGWDGLIYPIASTGEKADFQKDVLEIIRKEIIREQSENNYRYFFPLIIGITDESRLIADDRPSLVKAAILLRLGQTRLAEKLWAHIQINMGYNYKFENYYCSTAYEWSLSALNRATLSHINGRDAQALSTALSLEHSWDYVIDEFKKHSDGVYYSNCHFARDDIYLELTGSIISDQQRRKQERETITPAVFPENQPYESRRVSLHIRALEDIGGVINQFDTLPNHENEAVTELLRLGDDSVEQLADCVENDTRMTRTVSSYFGGIRPLPSFYLKSVRDVCYETLEKILETDFSYDSNLAISEAERGKTSVEKIRAFWKKYEGLPKEERWYRILADDSAAPHEWLAAASHIARLEFRNIKYNRAMENFFSGQAASLIIKPEDKHPLLTGNKDPSVSQLFEKRIKDLDVETPEQPNYRLPTKHLSWKMALLHAMWDPAGALPSLQKATGQCLSETQRDGFTAGYITHYLTLLFAFRVQANDPSALGEYSKWLREITSSFNNNHYYGDEYSLIPEHIGRPEIISLANSLFSDNGAPWNVALLKNNDKARREFCQLFSLMMTKAPPYRALLIQMLSDKTIVGQIEIANGKIITSGTNTQYDGTWTGKYTPTPLDIPIGSKADIRLCDLFAQYLNGRGNVPKFSYYWRIKERDKSIAAMITFLQNFTEN